MMLSPSAAAELVTAHVHRRVLTSSKFRKIYFPVYTYVYFTILNCVQSKLSLEKNHVGQESLYLS